MRRYLISGFLALLLAGASLPVALPVGAQEAITIELAPVGGSGISGQATVQPMDGQTMVVITLQGLEPNSRHAAHVHGGSCGGSVMYPLTVVVADAEGNGTSTSMVAAAPDASWWIQVHRAESPPGPGIACGQVPS
jgi:hypothetical protein